jgi:NADH-quinone oxidoreductase subunit J
VGQINVPARFLYEEIRRDDEEEAMEALGALAMNPNMAFFAVVAGLAALLAIGVVALNNPIRSALCLVGNFGLLAVLYFTLRAEMLGITQIVVYTGAIMVLFLFVIMLLNLGVPRAQEKVDWKRPVGILLGVGFFVLVASQVLPAYLEVTEPLGRDDFGKPEAIGRTLFTTYFVPFEAISLLLLIGIVGSILLAKRRI